MVEQPDPSPAERAALDDLQHAVEHLHRGCGALIAFHHNVGHAMDYLEAARADLEDAGREADAAVIRDEFLPAGIIDDRWTYELVQAYRDGLLADVTAFDAEVRGALAGGRTYLAERDLQRKWRERAGGRPAEPPGES